MFTYRYIRQIPTGIIQATAGQVFILVALEIIFSTTWLLALLGIDFLLRALGQAKVSPLAVASRKWIVPLFKLGQHPTPLKPKRFAAAIGFSMSLVAVILSLTGFHLWAIAVLSMLGFFAFLESFFGFCAGCKIYGRLVRWGLIADDDCPDCVINS